MKYFSLDEENKIQVLDLVDNTVTKEKIIAYFKITSEALEMIDNNPKDESSMDKVKDFLLMATSYFNDAKHFAFEKKNFVLAFGALNYAHAWLDAGARIGLFKVKDSRLFTVDD